SVLDPMAALAYAAAVTARVRLGVAVINAPFVSPGYLAKQAASVDVLSSGRLDLGLGLGWMTEEFTRTGAPIRPRGARNAGRARGVGGMPEEFPMAGAPMRRRGARTAEYVRVLRTLWGEQPAEFEGEFDSVPRGSALPGPVQPGGPPILLGGTAEVALRRAGR